MVWVALSLTHSLTSYCLVTMSSKSYVFAPSGSEKGSRGQLSIRGAMRCEARNGVGQRGMGHDERR